MKWNPFKRTKKPAPQVEVTETVVTDRADVIKLYGEVLLLDNNNPLANGHREKSKVIVDSPVPVYSDDNRLIGAASVERGGQSLPRVDAVIFLDYSTPERLDIENGVAFYIHPLMDDFVIDDITKTIKIIKTTKIKALFLKREQPNDKRISAVR
jgi:hypothetical protein